MTNKHNDTLDTYFSAWGDVVELFDIHGWIDLDDQRDVWWMAKVGDSVYWWEEKPEEDNPHSEDAEYYETVLELVSEIPEARLIVFQCVLSTGEVIQLVFDLDKQLKFNSSWR